MTILRGVSVLIVLVLAGLPSAWAGQRPTLGTPRATVESFYAYHLRDGCGFTQTNVRERRPWFTARLNSLLRREFDREREYRREHPQDVPFFNGDPFTSSQEYPVWFRVGPARRAGNTADVTLYLYFERGKAAEPEQHLVRLECEAGRWRIDDVVDSTGESLRSLLERPVYNP